MLDQIIKQLRATLPPVFAGSEIHRLTGGAINWGTIQNKRSERMIPDECFVKSGKRVLVVRDLFLDWWETTLTEAWPPTPRARRRRVLSDPPEAA